MASGRLWKRQCGRPIETYTFPEHPNALRAYLARNPPDGQGSLIVATLCAVELAHQFSGRSFTEEGIEAVARNCVRRTMAKKRPNACAREMDRVATHYAAQIMGFAWTKCERKELSPLYGLEPDQQFKECQIFVLE